MNLDIIFLLIGVNKMNLNQLQYFRVLAQTEHYGHAAEKLFITQPSLSRAISLLEEELGVELFTKSGRNVVLTKAGHVFFNYVDKSLNTLELGINAVKKYSNQEEILSVGCVNPFLRNNIFHTYLVNLASTDNLRLDMSVSQTDKLLKDLRNKKYDIVFCSYSPTAKDITFIPIIEMPFVVAMPKDDDFIQYNFIQPEQLQQRKMVFNTEPVYSSLIQQIFDYYQITPEIKGSSNEDSVLLRMVADKVGLLVSTDHIKTLSNETVFRPLKQDQIHRYIYLAYLKDAVHSQTINQIINYAKENALEEKGQQPKAIDQSK